MARGKGVGTLAREIARLRDTCGIHNTTFMPGGQLKPEQEEWLADRFRLWWDSWVAPLLEQLETKGSKKRERKA